jgi:hypothetical protein
MTNSSTRFFMGAVTGLGMAGISISVSRGAAALEPASVTEPELLINRDKAWLSDTDGEVGDREQLRDRLRGWACETRTQESTRQPCI